MRSVIAQATLSIAPMRCGSGVPIKVLEAWAVGVPVLATSWAVAGTSGRQGEDFILVGQHPVEWVAAITELLENPSARHWLVENGRRRLAADYSRETVRRQVLDVIRAAAPAPAAAESSRPRWGRAAGIGMHPPPPMSRLTAIRCISPGCVATWRQMKRHTGTMSQPPGR